MVKILVNLNKQMKLLSLRDMFSKQRVNRSTREEPKFQLKDEDTTTNYLLKVGEADRNGKVSV